jgi:uncharacterized protein (TIGR02145 family)
MKRLLLFFLLTALVLSCERNTAPFIDSLIAEPDSAYPGDTVTLTYETSDADGDAVLYLFGKSSGTWVTDIGTGHPAQWIAPKEAGDYYLTLTISDLTDKVADSVLIHVFDTVGFFTDARDGNQYNWVKIGKQIWMAENLANLPSVSFSLWGSVKEPVYYVYSYKGTDLSEAKSSTYYQTYGTLYNWAAAKISCPSGWHLPTDAEWKELEKFLGMNTSDLDATDYRVSGAVGHQLKEAGTNHWISPNDGATNSSGFNALPGGMMAFNIGYAGFMDLGRATYFWTATAYQNNSAWVRFLYSSSPVIDRHQMYGSYGHSVRCVKN